MQIASDKIVKNGPASANSKRRSGCPLNASVEMLGDRWSLLIIRDLMLFGPRTFKDFLGSHEHIASNILADRLRRLESYGIVMSRPDPDDGRKSKYLLTEKGLDLGPVLTEMVLWAARHEKTENQELIRALRQDKTKVMAAIHARWAAEFARNRRR